MVLAITWCKQQIYFKIKETNFIEHRPSSETNSRSAGPKISTFHETQRKNAHEALHSAISSQQLKQHSYKTSKLLLPRFHVQYYECLVFPHIPNTASGDNNHCCGQLC